jgi:hypothetical protein
VAAGKQSAPLASDGDAKPTPLPEKTIAVLKAGGQTNVTAEAIWPTGMLLKGRRVPWNRLKGPFPEYIQTHKVESSGTKEAPVKKVVPEWVSNGQMLIATERALLGDVLTLEQLNQKFTVYPELPDIFKAFIRDVKSSILAQVDPTRLGSTPDFERARAKWKSAVASLTKKMAELSSEIHQINSQLQLALVGRDEELSALNPYYKATKKSADSLFQLTTGFSSPSAMDELLAGGFGDEGE